MKINMTTKVFTILTNKREMELDNLVEGLCRPLDICVGGQVLFPQRLCPFPAMCLQHFLSKVP